MNGRNGLLRRGVIRIGRVVAFVLYFSYEFLVSNALVLREILSWRQRAAPAIVAFRLRCRSTLEIVTIANLVTLTPGTLTVEVSRDPPTLFVHGMFAGDPQAFHRQLADLEDRMLAAYRPVAEEPDPMSRPEADRR